MAVPIWIPGTKYLIIQVQYKPIHIQEFVICRSLEEEAFSIFKRKMEREKQREGI